MFAKNFLLTIFLVVLCTLLVGSFPAYKNDIQNHLVMCRLPPVKGHCRALIPRYSYNSATGKCYEFNFGGCDGNANNFDSYKQCMAVCGGVS